MKKEIYLTIDDSPSKYMKEKLDFLIKNKIPAIFFCIGKLMEENPDPVIYAIKNGYIIGNHSYSHPKFSEISLKKAYEEIKKTDSIINKLYKKAKVKRPIKLFRFPYGIKGGEFSFAIVLNKFIKWRSFLGLSKKEKIQQYLKQLGYANLQFENINYDYYRKYNLDKDIDIFWTYDFEEYRLNIENVLKKMEEKNSRQGGSLVNLNSRDIVLIHDHTETTKAFYKIINALNRKVIFKMPILSNYQNKQRNHRNYFYQYI